MKICPVRTELFHVDGRTDMTNIRLTFLNFLSAPIRCKFSAKIEWIYP